MSGLKRCGSICEYWVFHIMQGFQFDRVFLLQKHSIAIIFYIFSRSTTFLLSKSKMRITIK